jgi:hypothetical protein
MIPSSLIPGTREVSNRYQIYKEKMERGDINEEEYKLMTSKMMMGKSGCVRSLNSARIEGSIRMVISIGSAKSAREVVIPEAVANGTQVPHVVNGKIRYTSVKDGDWGLLVRQPCLWSGGIQPVVIRVSNEHLLSDDKGNSWDVNWSMKIPPQLCSPYAADFDGDEMSLFVVKNPRSVMECKSFSWDYDGFMSQEICDQVLPKPHNPVFRQPHMDPSHRFKLTMMATTVCWSDMWTRSDEASFKLSDTHITSGLSGSCIIKGIISICH